MTNLEWHIAARSYLDRLGAAEYAAQKAAWKKRRGFRFFPSEFHSRLIQCLNKNDEEGFKALKLTEGYASAVGV